MLAWAGLVGVVTAAVRPGRGLFELCRAMLASPSRLRPVSMVAVLLLVSSSCWQYGP